MEHLDPQKFSWMRDDAVTQLFDAFPKGSLRFVGGCVRNALMDHDDLHARKFRFVGEADLRIKEDYLRILRFFRFIAWYGTDPVLGDAVIDAEALKACRENVKGLKSLSAERVLPSIRVERMSLLIAPAYALQVQKTLYAHRVG